MLIATIISLFSFTHEYFISICDIEHNAANSTLEVSIQLTTHDLEKAVKLAHLGGDKEPLDSDAEILRYLQEHLILEVDGELVALEWVGKEIKLEDMWVYLEVADVQKLSSLKVKNTILLKEFEEQENRTNVKFPEKELKGATFTRAHTEQAFSAE